MSTNNYNKLDVLLLQKTAVEGYPPTLNQANMLVEAGLRVGLLSQVDYSVDSEKTSILNPAIKHFFSGIAWDSKEEKPMSLWQRFWNQRNFAVKYYKILHDYNPKVVIAYDPAAISLVLSRVYNIFKIIHFHELPETNTHMGILSNRQLLTVIKIGHKSDLCVIPDLHRANILQKRLNLKILPEVIMNCPRRLDNLPKNLLKPYLILLGYNNQRIVLYQGSISQDQSIDTIIKSIKYWPSDAIFIIIGRVSVSYKIKLEKLIQELQLGARVIFIKQVSYSELFKYTVGADIGLSIISPNNESWKYSAGAINKRFEYMAVGVPQIANKGPGVSDIIERNGCGICVDPYSCEEIGLAVKYLLDHPEKRKGFSQDSRLSHLDVFNYEYQFAKVLNRIKEICCV